MQIPSPTPFSKGNWVHNHRGSNRCNIPLEMGPSETDREHLCAILTSQAGRGVPGGVLRMDCLEGSCHTLRLKRLALHPNQIFTAAFSPCPGELRTQALNFILLQPVSEMALEVLAIHYTLPPHGFPEQETLQILSGAFCSAVEMNEDLGLQDGMLQPLLQNVPSEDELLGCKSLSLILFYRDICGILWCLLVLALSALQTSPNRISNKPSPNLHTCKWMANPLRQYIIQYT